MASMVSSRRSARERSVMATHALSKLLQRAKLKLFDRSFGAVESGRYLADALLLDEPHPNHPLLHLGQPLDFLKERDAPLDVVDFVRIGRIRTRLLRVAGAFAPVVRQGVRSDLEQPRRHRQPAPFETANRGQRLLEH